MTHTTPTADTGTFTVLARREMVHYAKHPLFLVGLALTVLVCAMGPDKNSSSQFHVIVPGAALGVLGLLVMISLVRRSDRAFEAAGTVVLPERTRTLALASATVVPFTAGIAFFGWAIWAYHDQPPLPSTMPFGDVGDTWAYAIMFALGTLSTVGGPVLGLVVARWLPFRGAGILVAVALVLVTIVMQGLVEPLRFVRVFMPWTYFGGPLGVEGDPERWVIMTGSPVWYCLYVVALCLVGVLLAVLHDREQARTPVLRALAVAVAVALVLGVLTMTQGVQATMVNPLPGPPL